MHIYQNISYLKYACAVCLRKHYAKPKKQRLISVAVKAVTHPRKPNILGSFGKGEALLSLCEFEFMFDMSFTRKCMSNKKRYFSKGDDPSFFS